MTAAEKAGLVSGFSMWETRAVERLGVQKADLSDGPNGIRKQLDYYDIATDASVQTVCFPSGAAVASSWDVEVLFKEGRALGETAKLHGIAMVLGPAVNIKRSPLCGRNFEYFSEDPYLAGELAAAYVKGLQGTGVSACVKHFAANSQETRRMTVNALVDEGALREIYLPAFEAAVQTGGADGVMSAYNALNGTSCSENGRLLTEILREEWGFDGLVVSDWGAVKDDPAAIMAGNDLKMPGFEPDPQRLLEALAQGKLTEGRLEDAATHVTAFLLKHADLRRDDPAWGKGTEDFEANHQLARALAAESVVLLKNSGVLPLKKTDRLLLVGENAKSPHFQGGGSSHVNGYRVDDGVELFSQGGYDCVYRPDFADVDGILAAAETRDVAVLFVGTPEAEESEGFDRSTLDLPQAQNALIDALCDAGARVVVVVYGGGAVTMPWAERVDAALAGFLLGEAANAAVYDVLTGAVNPSGRLAETFARRLEDTPAYLSFPGRRDTTFYGESLFVGYRYFDTKKIAPLFPFGHGLSYTAFHYSDAWVDKGDFRDDETAAVTVTVTNRGDVAGKEVVQLYVGFQTAAGSAPRPVKALRGFKKIALAPGQAETVTFTLTSRAFARYDGDARAWRVDTGAYDILLGASSADIRGQVRVNVTTTFVEQKIFTRDTLMGDIVNEPGGQGFIAGMVARAGARLSGNTAHKEGDREAFMKMVLSMPIKTLILIGMPAEEIDGALRRLNGGGGL
jgi:beta-glucosidase